MPGSRQKLRATILTVRIVARSFLGDAAVAGGPQGRSYSPKKRLKKPFFLEPSSARAASRSAASSCSDTGSA